MGTAPGWRGEPEPQGWVCLQEGARPTPGPPAAPGLCLLRFLASERALLLLFSDGTLQVSVRRLRPRGCAGPLCSGVGGHRQLASWGWGCGPLSTKYAKSERFRSWQNVPGPSSWGSPSQPPKCRFGGQSCLDGGWPRAVLAVADRAQPGLTQTSEAVVYNAFLVTPKHHHSVTVKPPSVSGLEQG